MTNIFYLFVRHWGTTILTTLYIIFSLKSSPGSGHIAQQGLCTEDPESGTIYGPTRL